MDLRSFDRVSLEMPIIPDPAQTLAAYESDEVDLAAVPSADVPRIREDPDLSQQVVQGDVLSLEYYGFDMRPESVFGESLALRKAFSEAVDKQTLIDTLRAGSAPWPARPCRRACRVTRPTSACPMTWPRRNRLPGRPRRGRRRAGDLALQLGYNTEADHEPTVEFLQEQWRTAFDVRSSWSGWSGPAT